MTPQEKIARLQAKSIKAKEDASKVRQEKWKAIKNDMPDIAELMTCINKKTGKLAAVFIVNNSNEIVLKTGKFDKPRNMSLKRMRF